MNMIADPIPGNSEQLPQKVEARRRDALIVEDNSALSDVMDTAKFEHIQRYSTVMSNSSLLPDHLCLDRDNNLLPVQMISANCFRVVSQAVRWGMHPFAIMDETYVVKGKLGYQGKLVAAVVNKRAGLKGRLNYRFNGTGEDREVVVIGQFDGEDGPREVSLRLKDARTDNAMWKKDPDQKLIYSGVVKWARRHCPEVVLGVLTDDDLERISSSSAESQQGGASDLNQIARDAVERLNAQTAARVETRIKETKEDDLPKQTGDAGDTPEQLYAARKESIRQTTMKMGGDDLQFSNAMKKWEKTCSRGDDNQPTEKVLQELENVIQERQGFFAYLAK